VWSGDRLRGTRPDRLPGLVCRGSRGGGCRLAGSEDLLLDGGKAIEPEGGFMRRPSPIEKR
jgi:hypothetical protein